jgi:hypothetical protein
MRGPAPGRHGGDPRDRRGRGGDRRTARRQPAPGGARSSALRSRSGWRDSRPRPRE